MTGLSEEMIIMAATMIMGYAGMTITGRRIATGLTGMKMHYLTASRPTGEWSDRKLIREEQLIPGTGKPIITGLTGALTITLAATGM